jgi:hypothetical protein
MVSCKQNNNNKAVSSKSPKAKEVVDSTKRIESSATHKAPIINITDTTAGKQLVLFIKDSASTSDRISAKLSQAFTRLLPDEMKRSNLKLAGSPIAWYRSQKTPFFFEAGLPVDKKPAKLSKGFFIRSVGGDSALVAHFFGPYELTPVAYEALNGYLKDRKKKRTESPYEIYVGNPYDQKGKKIDPYKVQTDIIFPYK